MLELFIREIPKDGSRQVDVEANEQDLKVLLDGAQDFEIVRPEEFEARLRLQRFADDSVRVAGRVDAYIGITCGRCMQHREIPTGADMEYLLLPRALWRKRYEDEEALAADDMDDDGARGVELMAEDLDIEVYDGESIDAKPLLREALLLELPTLAICPDSMRAQCDRDYEALQAMNRHAPQEEPASEEQIDPRWAALKAIRDKSKGSD